MQTYYVSKSENPASWPLGFEVPIQAKVNRKYPEFDAKKAQSMLNDGGTVTQVRKYFGIGSERIKLVFEECGIKFKTNGQKSYANALKFEEVPEFRRYIESLGYRTADSKKSDIAFNVKKGYWACTTIIKKPDGTKCLQMNSGIIGLYKQWKGIQ